jgi:hypothetical protein
MPEKQTATKPEVRLRRRRQPKPPGSAVLAQIDKKLSQALDARTEAMRKVSLLIYWQDRLNKATQEVEYLIAAQQKLAGHPVSAVMPVFTTSLPTAQMAASLEGMGSIPAKQPASTTGNVADAIGTEGGFS